MLILPPGARTPLRSPSTSRLCFTRRAPVAMLDMSANSAFRLCPVNIRMHSIDVCHPYSTNEHPCLGDSRFVPRSCPRSLTREPAGSRQLARCGGPSFHAGGVVFPSPWPMRPCHWHPCHPGPPPPSLSREAQTSPDQDHLRHTLRERCVAPAARGAFRLQRPALGSPSRS